MWFWGHRGLGICAIVSDVCPSAEHRKVYLPPAPVPLVESVRFRVNTPGPGPVPEDVVMLPGPEFVGQDVAVGSGV